MSLSSSTTPRSAASSPIGSCSGATPAPNCSFSWSSVRSNDARSRSSLLTKIARGMPRCLGELPRDLGLHLDALDRRHDEQREVGGLERGARRRRRSRRSPGVSSTLTLWPSSSNGASASDTEMPAALLLGVEVADGRAVLDPAQAGDRPGGEQQGLGQRGLAGAAVADEGDVADLRRRERLHPRPPGCAARVGRLYERSWPRSVGTPRRQPPGGSGAGDVRRLVEGRRYRSGARNALAHRASECSRSTTRRSPEP